MSTLFEIMYRGIAFAFLTSAVWASEPPFGTEMWVLKVAGCLVAALFWRLADNVREERRK